MAMSITLAELVDRIRERGAIRSNRVPSATLYQWINGAIAEVHRLVVDINPDFHITSDDISVVSGTAGYALPSDFWMGFGCDLLMESGNYANLRPFRWADRNQYPTSGTSRSCARYRFQAGNLEIRPTPSWASTVRVWYAPTPPTLSDTTPGTTDVWDTLAGFDDFVILSCLLKNATLEDEDTAAISAQLSSARKDVIGQVRTRDKAEPPRVRDVYREYHAGGRPSWDNP